MKDTGGGVSGGKGALQQRADLKDSSRLILIEFPFVAFGGLLWPAQLLLLLPLLLLLLVFLLCSVPKASGDAVRDKQTRWHLPCDKRNVELVGVVIRAALKGARVSVDVFSCTLTNARTAAVCTVMRPLCCFLPLTC